ncbi:MAG: hypothetical protein LBD96_02630 [Treponema sp.]|jgi:hypothetical protein|nr:hypothetical protein [Treponema sp.]
MDEALAGKLQAEIADLEQRLADKKRQLEEALSRISCGACSNRDFEPVSDRVIRNHFAGCTPASYEGGPAISFVMGVYPLLQNETCYFLAVDFDKQSWQEDAKAFMEPAGLKAFRPVWNDHVQGMAPISGSFLKNRFRQLRPGDWGLFS